MLRALLFCLIFCPAFLPAQDTAPTNNQLIENPVLGKEVSERLFRVGLVFKKDRQLPLDHRYVRGALVAWQARSPVFMAALDWQPSRKARSFLLTLEAGYQKDLFFVDSRKIRDLHSSSTIPIYQETIDYRRWQVALGLRFECFPKYAISPFLASKLLLAYPTQLFYHYESNDPNNLGGPVEVQVQNGVEMSPGWEHSAGLRARIAGRFHFSLAYFQMALEQKMTWAWVPYRDFGNTLIGFKNRGLLMSLQYAL